MILTFIAVGDEYIQKSLPCIKKYQEFGWNVKVLTNKPHYFDNTVETFKHDKVIFSYIDKITFPLMVSQKYREGVLYVDCDWLCEPSDKFIQEFKGSDKFLYEKSWPHGDNFVNYKNDGYFTILLDYFYRINFTEYDNLKTIVEMVYYFPYIENVNDVIYDVEKIRPVFEYMSTIIQTGYSGIGNAEGLVISYVLNKHNIPIEKFDDIYQ